jgi:hypothetical protein
VSFIPSVSDDQPVNRLLVVSGQSGGGMQIIVPFEPSQNNNPASFMLPQLERGESISAVVASEDNLALGTSQCRVLQYKMAGYTGAAQPRKLGSPTGKEFVSSARSQGAMGSPRTPETRTSPRPKQALEMPSFVPPLPPLSLEPSVLQSDNPNVRSGMDDRVKSIFTAYTLLGDPKLTPLASGLCSSFGPLTDDVLLTPSRRNVSSQLTAKAETSDDFLMTIPSASLNLNLMENHSDKKSSKAHRYKNLRRDEAETLPNPNKTIYSKKLFALCYKDRLNQSHKSADDQKGSVTVSAFFPNYHSSCLLVCTFSLRASDMQKIRLRSTRIINKKISHRDIA